MNFSAFWTSISVPTVYTVSMTTRINWNLILSQTDERAMYQQIMDQVLQHITIGDLPQGTKLPSIRELATTLKVSMITIKRAYLELERMGVIVTRQGKGSWVAENLNRSSLRQGELESCLERAAKLAAEMGLGSAELTTILKKYTNE